jgi:lambda family phage portal protein
MDPTMSGASVIPLMPGDEMQSFTPNSPNANFEPFMTFVLRQVAAGLNMPYELLVKDFSKTNYSSARAALMEAWRFFRGKRKWLSDNFCTPAYILWLEERVNAGKIDGLTPTEFYANWYAYARCRWIGPGRGWIDPVKEALAAELRMDNNISTLEDECAEQGGDWEEKLEQRAFERRRMTELGIPLPELLTPSPPPRTVAQPDPVEPVQPGTPTDEPAQGNARGKTTRRDMVNQLALEISDAP